jgi:hypothetical protein
MRAAEPHGSALRLLFNYHGQIDPEIGYQVLWSIGLR